MRPFPHSLRLCMSLIALSAVAVPAARAAEADACRTLETRMAQGRGGLSAMEMSLLLFGTAENGCVELAREIGRAHV